jgi:hypothetical protein
MDKGTTDRACSRNGCAEPAESTVSLAYGAKEVLIGDLRGDRDPNLLELCGTHADRLSPPLGWALDDRRSISVLPD